MGERPEPKEKKYKGPEFILPWGGQEYHFRPDNSQLFLHSQMPEADHFRLRNNGCIFRGQIGNFEDMADYARENGYSVVPNAFPDDDTYQEYVRRFGEPELPPFKELTPRQERKMKFASYLLEMEHITPTSFEDKL